MRKWLGIALAGLAALAWTGTARAETKYALCVGINTYKEISSLKGCVNDANYFYTNLVARGGWSTKNMTRLTNNGATKDAIRKAISNYAAKAVSGDVFVYQHSSHGGQFNATDDDEDALTGENGKDTFLCVYDEIYSDNTTAYNDYEMAVDLASFKDGVKVVVIVDACHSGGLFKSKAAAKRSADAFDLAGRVTAIMEANRAQRRARGENVDKTLPPSQIGWVTAAEYYEYSLDGGYYDSDKWLTSTSKGKVMGGVFLGAFTWAWWNGTCDTKSGYGDNDQYADPYECWRVAYEHCTSLSKSEAFTPQFLNKDVLRSVELGWVGDEEPSGVRFASIPAQTATVGQALNYRVVATNSDGSSGIITYSVSSSSAPSGSYSVNATSGEFSFTPAADGIFTFDFVGTNATAKTSGKATMTVTASLAAPAGLDNTGITDSSFTANWDAVPGAVSYFLEVFAADSDASSAAKAASDAFQLVTSADELTAGEYLILAATNNRAMKNTFVGTTAGVFSYEDVTVDNSAISSEDAALVWTLEGDASSCTLFNADAGKFANPSTARACGWSDTAAGAWKLALSDGLVSVINAASTSWRLQYNASSPRFAMYEGSGQDIRFFRRDGASGALFSGDVGNVTSYTVEGLIPGDYTWRVRAVGNAKGPWSESQDVTLFADPSAPPSIRAIADIEIDVGETATATVAVSTPADAPVNSLSITAGDPAATLEDGVFSFAPAASGTYDFTITAVNANGSGTVSFAVVASLADPETPEQPAVIGSDSFTAAWEAVPGAESYELLVIEGQGGSSGGGGSGGSGGSSETLTETFAKATFAPGGSSYASQTISGGDLGTWTATQCRGDQGGLPTVGGTGTLTSPEMEGGVSAVEFDYSWPFTDTMSGDIDLYVGGSKVASATVTGGTAGTATYSFSPVPGATSIEFANAYATAKKLRIRFDEIRIATASGKSIAKAVGDVVLSNNVGNVTSYKVTGLQPLTEYTFAFRAIAGEEASAWSEPVSVKTADGPAPAAWADIPAQSAAVGYPFSIDLSAYVSGVPTPTLSLASGTAELNGTVLSFTPAAVGDYAFTVTASNTSGDPADATFTVSAIEHQPTKYAVCVGINEYADISGLEGCVNDSIYMENNLVERGGWAAENVVRLNDAKATKAAIRKAIADVAAKAQAGDTFVYQHSSHGGQFNATDDDEDPLTGEEGKAVFLCVYDEDYYDNTTAYNDYEIAADLAAFNAGVKVAVIVDACHSGGLFKSKEAARAAARSFDLAGRVTAIMEAARAARKARGENVAKALSPAEIGWATAAEYYEYSYDGGFYHTDEWLTNNVYGDEYWVGSDDDGYYNYPASFKQGGVFTASATWGWWNGDADTDANGSVDVLEFWQKGYDFCSVIGDFWYEDSSYNYFPQSTNVAVLKSIELGWIVDPTIPANPQASDVTASSFLASWDSVDGAASYNLYVQKKGDTAKAADQELMIDESFETGEIPDGWLASTGISLISGKTDYGTYCVAFKAAGASLITPAVENPSGISFKYKRSSNTAAWRLDVAVGPSPDGPWTSLATINDPTMQWQEFYAAIAEASDTQYLKFTDGRTSGGAERYIDLVQVTGSSATWEDLEGYSPASVAGTSKVVDGLEMGTEYRFSVTAIDADNVESLPSERVNVTTAEEDSAPVWSDIPEQSAVAGDMFEFDAAAYVKASPAAAVTLVSSSADAADYEFEDGLLLFTPPAEGSYEFEFQAANTLGEATATMTVVAAGAPVLVPALALSNPQATSFDAAWTACTDVSGYTLQVATDDQFTTGSAGGEIELFANPATTVTPPEGWTYDIANTSGKYLQLTKAENSVVSPAVSTKGLSSLTVSFEVRTYGGVSGDSGTALVECSTDGSTWTEVGTAVAAANSMSKKTIDAASAIGQDSVQFRWTAPYADAGKGIGIQNLVLAGEGTAGDGSLVKELPVDGTSTTVTGLDPETLYYARVKGESDWSEVQSIRTASDVPAAPAWLDLPAQTATAGLEFGIDLSSYVTGSPFPAITVEGEPTDGGAWVRTFDEAGTYTFALLAKNTEGTATATLTVVVSPAPSAKYAVCVGLSEYDMAAFEALGLEVTPLKGCVNDATRLKKNLSERGGWAEADIALLTNGAATKAAIRGAIAAAAAKAKAGDTFVYEHSSHGLQGDELDDYTAALATYENLYNDTELAEDLGAFADGVKVVVLIDACHSAGMIDDDDDDGDGGAGSASKARPAAAFDIARRVSALIDANRAVRKARGEDVSRTLTSDQIGWVTAAAYDETSKDGGYYDTDAWMSDDDAEGEERGGLFLASITWGWWSGKADVTGEGDGDGWFDAYEGWSFSTPFCAELDQTPQYLHEDVLRSVELGWVGDTAPSEAILFDPVPGVSVGIGEEAVLDGIVARNPDGTTDGITLSIVDPSPEEADYAFADGKLTFTPDEDGLFLFTVRAVKGRTSATKILGVTAILPAPVAQEVADADIAEDGFTARWLGVDAARNYQLQVSTDPDFSMGEPDELVNEGFDDVTNKVASLPDDWTFSGTFGIYATGGEAPPSIKLSTDGATLTTPPFKLTSAENGLAFWTKGNPSGTDMTSTLTVQQLVGEEWQTLKDGTFVPSTDGETKEFESLDKAATCIRFVMAKTAGNIAIDDVVVAQSQGGVEVDEDEIPASETSYAVEDLEPGTTYYFRVRALANSRSAWSETIEVTTAGEKPIPVPDLTVMAPETTPPDTSLVAFWLCPGAEEFRLQAATDEEFATLVFDEQTTESVMIVTGLTPETTYYVRVCALDGARAGDWSNVESITTASSGTGGAEVRITSMSIAGGIMTLGFEGPGAKVYATTNLSAVGYAEWTWVPYADVSGTNATITLPADTMFNNYRIAQ